MKTQARIGMMMLVVLLGHAAWEVPCVAGPAPPRSLEDALFDGSRPGQLHLADPRRINAEDREGPKRLAPSGSDRPSPWAKDLGAAGVSEDDSPLRSVAQRMREVQGMLHRAQCGATTQHAQREILEGLDHLLRQARQPSGAASATTGRKPGGNQPSKSVSSNRSGDNQKSGAKPGGSGEAAAGKNGTSTTGSPHVDAGQMRTMLKRLWGELPPRRRQQMLQLPVEEFLPRYELLIEQYFRRLSEEKKKNEYP